jgi:acetoacetate decarboxylase
MKTLFLTTRVVALLFICTFAKGQPYAYKGSEFIEITFQTSQDVLNRLVPKPLVANSEGLINLDIGLQKMVVGLNYHEMILSIPVEFNGKKGTYAAILYLDNARAITPGREIWGFPKYFADISFQKDTNKVAVRISKDEKLLIEANLELGNIINNYKAPDPLSFVLKYIPSVEEGSVDVKQLNSVYLTNYTFTKLQLAKAKLTINSIPDNSIGEIPIIKILNATYFESNFILGFGKIEYDYLKQK